jgi:hypothetical protein
MDSVFYYDFTPPTRTRSRARRAGCEFGRGDDRLEEAAGKAHE